MYHDKFMQESIKKVEAARAENVKLDPRRMTAEEKETLLATYHPDYRQDQFRVLEVGPNKGEKVPLELCEVLQGNPRVKPADIDLSKIDYDGTVNYRGTMVDYSKYGVRPAIRVSVGVVGSLID